MIEVPNEGLRQKGLLKLPLGVGKSKVLAAPVVHVFSHFRLVVTVKVASLPASARQAALPAPYFWASIKTLEQQALPTVMRNILLAAGLMTGQRKH
jgi:adenine-specific DNA glycosylase